MSDEKKQEGLCSSINRGNEHLTTAIYVIGCGGVGGYLALPLLKYFEYANILGRRKLIFVDGDRFEKKNTERQICSGYHVGENKANSLAALASLFADKVAIDSIPEYVTKDNITNIIRTTSGTTFVFNCVDNKASAKLIEDYCSRNAMPYITGGNEYYDGDAYLWFPTLSYEKKFPHRSDIHLELKEIDDVNPGEHCHVQAEQFPQLGVVNNMVSANMLVLFNEFVEVRYADSNERTDTLPSFNEIFFDTRVGRSDSYNRLRNIGD